MPRLTQAQIKEKADEWAKLREKIEKAVSAKEAFLEPLVAPHDARIEKLQDEADNIEAEVLAWLNAQKKDLRLEGEKAIAEFSILEITRQGPRVIDAEKFIDKAKKQKKNPWTCIKVEVGKAEKLLGPKDIDSISERSETTTEKREASLTLK